LGVGVARRRRAVKPADEVVWRYISGWRYFYEYKLPRMPPPPELVKISEEIAKKEEGKSYAV